MPRPWWRDAVFYQVYPRSFADSDSDGVGDLEGIRAQLDHLVWLGVDALWMSPFYPSPQEDFGYDVADYCDVDPRFGTLEDFDRLVAETHERGMRIIVDWVPNHVSDQHPWFRDARRGVDAEHRNWFVWREGTAGPDGAPSPPNNWIAAFPPDTPAWSFDEASRQWYLHLFLPSQPDLEWDNPEVEAAMHDVLRFWLARGVDGFRADVVHALAKPPGLPSTPDDLAGIPHCVLNHVPATHERLRKIRGVLEEYGPDRMMVGEAYLLSTAEVATYYGTPAEPELHLSFNIPLVHTPWDAVAFGQRLEEIERDLDPRDAWPVWALSSHDEVRHRTRFDRSAPPSPDGTPAADPARSERRLRAAAVLTLTQRGTPFLYQGEELGLAQAEIPPDAVLDPGGRDGCRAPIPWTNGPGHGWSTPWLPLPPEPERRNVAAERDDPASTLHFYRRLIGLRTATPALHAGGQVRVDAAPGLLAWRRSHPAGDRVVVVNFTGATTTGPDLAGDWVVELASDAPGDGATVDVAYARTVNGDQAIVLRPA